MVDFRGVVLGTDFYGYNVNPAGSPGGKMSEAVESCQGEQLFPLPRVDFPFRGNRNMGILRFDLHKNHGLSFLGNDINFTKKAPIIPLKNGIIVFQKISAGVLFSQASQLPSIEMPESAGRPTQDLLKPAEHFSVLMEKLE